MCTIVFGNKALLDNDENSLKIVKTYYVLSVFNNKLSRCLNPIGLSRKQVSNRLSSSLLNK